MGYGLGVDLGTTFTAAAVSGDFGTRVVPLGRDVVAPSTVFIGADGTVLTGDAAEAAGAADPLRVSRGHKRRLGDPTLLVIGGVAYSPAALLAAQLRDVVALVTALHGGPPDAVVLTCPAIWGPYRREHFDEVPRLAGLDNVHIITEPEAAATHYSTERRLGNGELVAVYDLGGGTFDTTILRAHHNGTEILGTPEGIERMGGIDFDEALLTHLDTRLDGALTTLDPTDPTTTTTLTTTRTACIKAKEDLSLEPDVTIHIPLPHTTHHITITRTEFNDMIRPSLSLTTAALQRTIHSAGLRPGDLAGVLLAGGSSRIPLVPQMVSDTFGKPVRVSLHPKFTVALGAATTARPKPAAAPVPFLPPPPPPAPGPRRRLPRWLVPALVATVLVGATALVGWSFRNDEPTAQGGTGPAEGPSAASSPAAAPREPGLVLFEDGAVAPYQSTVGSPQGDWVGTRVGVGGEVTHPTVSVTSSAAGLRATWNGSGPGQVYLQDPAGGSDLRRFLDGDGDGDGALVLDVVVRTHPTGPVSLAAHCGFPCSAEIPATSAFRRLPVDREAEVRVPLSCFTAAGLDAGKVDTPFLIATGGAFDATFTGIRWVPGAGAGAIPCEELG
ncbi:Hsp70 family protein [Saccharothrix sp. BKS2]|uniref:Hsp70 family protein n=1 Tax=Saccharothrix sp. BKS2 TaxID=3064400 RepID=UPI0039E97CCC